MWCMRLKWRLRTAGPTPRSPCTHCFKLCLGCALPGQPSMHSAHSSSGELHVQCNAPPPRKQHRPCTVMAPAPASLVLLGVGETLTPSQCRERYGWLMLGCSLARHGWKWWEACTLGDCRQAACMWVCGNGAWVCGWRCGCGGGGDTC